MNLEDVARDFWRKRQIGEKHTHERFYVHGPKKSLMQAVLTGFLKNSYYTSAWDVLDYTMTAHKEGLKDDEDFHLKTLEAGRNTTFLKDQILIGLGIRRAAGLTDEERLLQSFPPHLLLRYVDALRKGAFGRGAGWHDYAAIRRYLKGHEDEGRLAYDFMRYPNAMRDLVRLSHYKTDMYRWLKGETGLDTQLDALLKARELFAAGENDGAANLMVAARLPFEVMRSNLRKKTVSRGDVESIAAAAESSLSPKAAVLNLAYFWRILGESTVDLMWQVYKKSPAMFGVTIYDLYKAKKALAETPLAPEIDKLALDLANQRDIFFKPPEGAKVSYVFDVSGSMGFGYGDDKRYLDQVELFMAMTRPEEAILFNHNVWRHRPKIEGLSVESLKASGSTNITAGLTEALKDEPDLIFLVTDEQSNVGPEVMNLKEQLAETPIFSINPTPYPAHTVSGLPNVFYVPAVTPESIKAVELLYEIGSLDEEGSTELIEKLLLVEG